MGELKVVEVYSYLEWTAGTYRADDGEEYEITFTKSYDTNIGYEHRELVNVEKANIFIPPEDPIWEEIQNHLGEEVTAK